MEILLIRHAEPEHVTEGTGAADPGLTPRGRSQAAALAAAAGAGWFGEVDAVVISSMLRARQTAAPLAEVLGVHVEADDRLVELDAGWTTYGTDVHSMPSRGAAYDALNGGRWGPNSYDPPAFAARVRAGIDELVDQEHGERVAVVCHGGVISAYLAQVLDGSRLLFFAPDHCSISRVLAGPGAYREMLSANETLHMRLPVTT